MINFTLLEFFQNKATLEKQKQQVESDAVDLANELKHITSAKQESERKRKQAEQATSELHVRLAEIERGRSELADKTNKLQVF